MDTTNHPPATGRPPFNRKLLAALALGSALALAGPAMAGPATAAQDANSTQGFLYVFGASDSEQAAYSPVLGRQPVTALAAGNNHTLALTTPGRVEAWGSDSFGQSEVPVILSRSKATAVAAGANHSLALTGDGAVVAWGRNASGQSAVPPQASSGATLIAAGGSNSMALTGNGAVISWGDNAFGQNQVPASLAGAQIKQIAAGAGFEIALTKEGKITAWGRNDYGQTEIPATVAAADVVAVSAGTDHSLALTRAGTVLAWGQNTYGQLDVPALPTGQHITAIAAGAYHSLALTDRGTVLAWGENAEGQSTVPRGIGHNVMAIAAGESHSVVFSRGGTPAAPAIPTPTVATTAATPQTPAPAATTQGGITASGATAAFTPGQPWLDTSGKAIQGHGGQVVTAQDSQGKTIYYWYGEDRSSGYQPMAGVHAYSSYDLHNWTDRGLVLRTLTSPSQLEGDTYFANLYADYTAHEREAVSRDLDSTGATNADGRAIVLERPKVVYNKTTREWVLWVHADGPSATSSAQYAKAQAGVAVSDSPFGPFRYVDSYRLDRIPANDPNNQEPSQLGMARDMNLFTDDDGTTYIVYSSEENRTMYISRLNASYTYLNVAPGKSVDGVDFSRNFQGAQREAPAIFKYDGTYYMITSKATGWAPNAAAYATAPAPLGPWTMHGNPATGAGASTTFDSQSTSVIAVDPAQGKYIYMGDRWTPSDLANAPAIWLPLTFGPGDALSMSWLDKWTLSDLDNRGTFDATVALPASVLPGSDASVLPTTAVVRQGGTSTVSAVTWANVNFSSPGAATVTATFASNGRSQNYTVPVVPANLVYFADPGSVDTADLQAIRSSAGASLENSVKDQPLGVDPGTGRVWGYDNQGTALNDGGSDIFTTLRYVTKQATNKSLPYSFGGLEPGSYTVYVGLYDPWAQWAPNRGAKIAINGTVVAANQRISGTPTTAGFPSQVPDANGTIRVTLTPTTADDVQLSWIMVARN